MTLTFGAHISVIGITAWADPTYYPNTNYQYILSNDTGSDSQHATFPAVNLATDFAQNNHVFERSSYFNWVRYITINPAGPMSICRVIVLADCPCSTAAINLPTF
jgi:hypothetical protein